MRVLTNKQIDNTSQDTFVYKTDEQMEYCRYYKTYYLIINLESISNNAEYLLVDSLSLNYQGVGNMWLVEDPSHFIPREVIPIVHAMEHVC